MRIGRDQIGVLLLGAYAHVRKKDMSIVRPTTRLLIEGYPRSANTLSVAAFRYANGCATPIAHHLHSHQQFRLAKKFGTPAVLLIRGPLDAIASLALRERGVCFDRALADYCLFYECAWEWRECFVIATFSDVLNGFGRVIGCVNKRFGTDFVCPPDSPGDVKDIVALVERMDMADSGKEAISDLAVGRPSEHRLALKEEVLERIQQEASRSLADRAVTVYERFEAMGRGGERE